MAANTKKRMYVNVEGFIKFENKYRPEDLMEMKQRSSVLITSHLFHKDFNNGTYELEPYVADSLFKNAFPVNSQIKNINYNFYICDQSIIRSLLKDREYEVEEGFDLKMSEIYFIRISYRLKIKLTLEILSPSIFQPAPHVLWRDLIDEATRVLKYNNNCFCFYKSDNAIIGIIRKNPMVYYEW